MSGIAGIVSFERKLNVELENIRNMTNALVKRGSIAQKVKITDYGLFGCTTTFPNAEKDKQIPLSLKYGGDEYTVCFDGLIYNTDEIKAELRKKGFNSEMADDAEIVLNAYCCWGAGCLSRLNGIFAFSVWNSSNKELFVARDRFGIKPFYYTFNNGCLIFASEIKGLLANSNIDAIVDKKGICEIIGLGPAQTRGCGVFYGINEIMPAHFAVYNKNGFNSHCYWRLESKEFDVGFDECLDETKTKVFKAINSQLQAKGRNMAFFLSGGLDSSAITAIAAQTYGRRINTFSLRYSGNDDYFEPTEYQPTSDDYYIDLMSKNFDTEHSVITVSTENLIEHLTDSVEARDLPGMADVDSSLYFLCKEIGKDFNGALSGECADEVFGGYPWFHRKEDFESDIFPWAKNIRVREELINRNFMDPKEISAYIRDSYCNSIRTTPVCDSDSQEEKRRREISKLNLDWFMYTLGARSERIGMNCGLEIRMPFCDHKLVEYVWNIPWKYKAYNGREKGLLRKVFEGILPEEILERKKSPFPKTFNPEYENTVKQYVAELLRDKNSAISSLINEKYIFNLMNMPSDYGKPWFGQLMATPQLYAYLIQLDHWIKKYNITFRI